MKNPQKIFVCLIAGLVAGLGCVSLESVKAGQEADVRPVGESDKLTKGESSRRVQPGAIAKRVDLAPDPVQKPTASVPATPVHSTAAIWIDPTTGMKFVRIPGGSFQMGNPEYMKVGDRDEGPVHEVCVDEFYMGRYEVTVGEFSRFSEATGYRNEGTPRDLCYMVTGDRWLRTKQKNWRHHNYNQEENEPAVCLSWEDAQAFAEWLSSHEGGQIYRLPSEAEWEYAARAGSDTSRFWGDDPNEACNYANVHDQTSRLENKFTWTEHNCDDGYARTAPVGSYQPNAFGLYDMLGNVWEWCQDRYSRGYYSRIDGNNQSGSSSPIRQRVTRGGSWANEPTYVRSTLRSRILPHIRFDYVGFRLVYSPEREGKGKSCKGE